MDERIRRRTRNTEETLVRVWLGLYWPEKESLAEKRFHQLFNSNKSSYQPVCSQPRVCNLNKQGRCKITVKWGITPQCSASSASWVLATTKVPKQVVRRPGSQPILPKGLLERLVLLMETGYLVKSFRRVWMETNAFPDMGTFTLLTARWVLPAF